jgi:hypothetical protein
MSSTTTLRNDVARTGTNPNFPIQSGSWRKYVSLDLGTTTIGGTTFGRPVRAGVLVVENWLFNSGPLVGQTQTLVLVSTTTNEIYCYSESNLIVGGTAPLWHTSLGVTPMTRTGSNIAPPLGICGTPVVDTANRRMFVVAMWNDGTGHGKYSIFNIALDTGNITTSQELVDGGSGHPTKFNGDLLDQRTAINLVSGWLWLGFADFYADDTGTYYGWVVAIDPNDLTTQLYQPMVSQKTAVYAGGVWGPGGVAAAADGTVFALTGNATNASAAYWTSLGAKGPGSVGDYFNGIVRVSVTGSGPSAKLNVVDWFQASAFTQAENAGDWDFGGSSPVVLPLINGRQLTAFVPKDGNIFVLDSHNLGNFSVPLTLEKFADAFVNHGDDTKVAIAFLQTPSGQNILIVGADSNGALGGFAAYSLNATATPPTLTQLWKAPSLLSDSFGSPSVITSPVPDPSKPPNPIGLAWIIDGADAGNNYLKNCAMRAYDVLTGAIAYDSTVLNDVTEQIPHFAPITSGGNSVFCTTSTGFMGFTQRPYPAIRLGLCDYSGKLYAAWKGETGDDRLFYSAFDGTSWVPQETIAGNSSVGPGLAVFGSSMFAAWKGENDDQRLFFAGFSGTTWLAQAQIPGVASSIGPSLAGFDSKLYAVWKGDDNDQRLWYASFDGTKWSAQAQISGVGSSLGPSLTVFAGKLYAAWKGVDGDQNLWYASFDGTKWSAQAQIPGVGSNIGPSLAVFAGKMYAAWKGEDDDQRLWFASFDGTKWSAQAQIPGVASSIGPSLAGFGSKLYAAWKGEEGDQQLWYASFDGTKWSAQANIPGNSGPDTWN